MRALSGSSTAGEAAAASGASELLGPGAAVIAGATLLIHNVTDVLTENSRGREQLAAIESIVVVENARLIAMAEHTKNKRKSTEAKHEEGEARKGRDRGGEKGDKTRQDKGMWPRRPPGGKTPRGGWPPKPDSSAE